MPATPSTPHLKIPNFTQNLFGDGVLSASFIPVYTQLVAKGDQEEADKVAGIIGSLLALLNAVVVLVGILAAPYLIDIVAPGFHGEKRELTIKTRTNIFFRVPEFLSCPRGAWVFSIATASFFSPTLPRCFGIWPSSRRS